MRFFSVLLLGLLFFNSIVGAAPILVQVTDSAGQAVADAVVYAEPAERQPPSKISRKNEIEQKDRKFLPFVTVIQTGTEISFPNNDTVRHHVYSFSATKVFELKLYSGVPGNPVLFDKAGTVVVGCNIHDQMIAYIHVVNTPYFAKTDASGMAKIDGPGNGKYRLKAWHFSDPNGKQIAEQTLDLTGSEASASFKLNIKPIPLQPKARPDAGIDKY